VKGFGFTPEQFGKPLEAPRGPNTRYTVEHKGQQVSLTELSKLTGISYTTLHKRYKAGIRGGALVDKHDRRGIRRK